MPTNDEVEEWLATRKREALKIDPETAEVTWWYAQTADPYGVDPTLPDEYQQIGRESFACRPGSDIWVWFGDLPDTSKKRLWEKHRRDLAFPAGFRKEGLEPLWRALESPSNNLRQYLPEPLLAEIDALLAQKAEVRELAEVRLQSVSRPPEAPTPKE